MQGSVHLGLGFRSSATARSAISKLREIVVRVRIAILTINSTAINTTSRSIIQATSIPYLDLQSTEIVHTIGDLYVIG